MPRPDWNKPIAFPAFATWLILLLSGATACGLAAAQSDTWWHLRAGQDIWRTQRVSLVERYSYTADGRYWPDHEWLWQLLAYGLHELGGLPLLALVNGVLAIGAVAISLPRHPTRWVVLGLVAAIASLVAFWAIRPQVASLFLFALLLRLLRTERWWPIPLLMLLWANLHGAVATGGVVLIAATGAAVVLAVRTRSGADVRRARVLTVVTTLSGLATLATPLGFRLWTYIVDSIGRSKSNEVLEWQSAFQVSFLGLAVWGWVLLVAIVVVKRRRQLSGWPIVVHLATTVALVPFGITAIRNLSFLVLAALPLVVALLDAAPSERPDDAVPRGRRLLTAAGTLLALGVVAMYAVQPPRLGWTPMSTAAQQAVEACPGPVYTTYYGGGYLIWFTPTVKVFVDNRQDPYPDDIVAVGTMDPATSYRPAFERFGVVCAALAAEDTRARDILTRDGWRPAYADGAWSLLVKP